MVDFIDEDIKEVMDITGLDKAKATKLFKAVAKDLDDGTDDELCSYDVIEVIKTENGSNVGRHYATSTEPKAERKPRERKVDADKAELITALKQGLTLKMNSTGIEVVNESKLNFTYKGAEYTVTLTRHNSKK